MKKYSLPLEKLGIGFMPYLSLIVPVYNRPQEVQELLESLAAQDNRDFEIIIVEDGSTVRCDRIVGQYKSAIDIKYFFKENSGPGLSRNYGAERAEGKYVVFLDSDCIIPRQYTQVVRQACQEAGVDAFGGPDRAHDSFTNIQKAINYSMTSFFTTGGIRGQKQSMEKFHPRSFNMGFSQEVLKATGGFSGLRFGEDIDMSIRIMAAGFKTCLLPEAYVFHKRRTSFRKFFKQVYNSGMARINLYLLHPHSLKLVHFLPACFVIGCLLCLLGGIFFSWYCLLPLLLLIFVFFIDSWRLNKRIKVAFLSIVAAFIQLFAYGIGFIHAVFAALILKRPVKGMFVRNFYK